MMSENNTEYQTSVSFSCKEGYELVPANAVKVCQSNKQWSSDENIVCKSKSKYFSLYIWKLVLENNVLDPYSLTLSFLEKEWHFFRKNSENKKNNFSKFS